MKIISEYTQDSDLTATLFNIAYQKDLHVHMKFKETNNTINLLSKTISHSLTLITKILHLRFEIIDSKCSGCYKSKDIPDIIFKN